MNWLNNQLTKEKLELQRKLDEQQILIDNYVNRMPPTDEK